VNYGKVGDLGRTTDTIRIYDATRTNAPKFFDVDWGSVRPNVVFQYLSEPMAESYKKGCATEFAGIVVLPIKWQSFSINEVNGYSNLTWQASLQTNTKFIIERSFDSQHFTALTTIPASSNNLYSWQDKTINGATTAYYRIKSVADNGEVSYSETKKLTFKQKAFEDAIVYPSPFTSHFNWSYLSKESTPITFFIRSANGQLLLQKEVKLLKGQNTVPFTDLATLSTGLYTLEVYNQSDLVTSYKLVKK
jgi:hypothetical protein